MRAFSWLYGSLQQSHATEVVAKAAEYHPARYHILEARKAKPSQTMKLVLALAGTAAAFVAPVRAQRLIQVFSPETP